MKRITSRCMALVVPGLFLLSANAQESGESHGDLAQQIAELMSQGPSGKAHERFIHAKGIVCEGMFRASSAAADISRAAHLQGGDVHVTVRFSDGAPDISVADATPEASPQGMAIRFESGGGTDIMAISHNGFLVGTGEEFLAFQRALAATESTTVHPTPIELFLRAHPAALKFVQELNHVPVSFGNESFYSNNALVFVNSKQERRAGRYQIIPVDGERYMSEPDIKSASPNFLSEEIRARLSHIPIKYRLVLQLAGPEDQTRDGSVVWPDDRKRVDLGILTITAVVPDSAVAERRLAFDPTHLIDGIELSDDPLPALRSRVYVYSVAGRSRK